ncbi:hypothetical protein KOR34_14350 [Posidoniimonas corsicana]|uniref:Carboxypeptidase regulatory-like domain-containing protein n=1 Tax=Posidoniimonas corsicana TaxID=1938618 RepID=A0A5C5VF80_9BACT|nr:carboxypeptidase-like regulatory domain-containing protein [Posidoniimonas corsicana]TWT36529.1 hypothetical protein KOR34_14350 [Posidoniimonas corsicana]
MPDRFGWRPLGLLGLGVAFMVGCGSSAGLVPVEGVVTLDGNPLPNCQVLFYVPGGGAETNFTDVTDAQGKFSLTTINNEGVGIKPGNYTVQLRTGFAGPELTETDPIPKELVPPAQQEQQFEVPPEGDANVTFALTSK